MPFLGCVWQWIGLRVGPPCQSGWPRWRQPVLAIGTSQVNDDHPASHAAGPTRRREAVRRCHSPLALPVAIVCPPAEHRLALALGGVLCFHWTARRNAFFVSVSAALQTPNGSSVECGVE